MNVTLPSMVVDGGFHNSRTRRLSRTIRPPFSFMSDPITDPDQTCTDPLYWEKVLRSHKLGVERGAHVRVSSKRVDEQADALRKKWQDEAKEEK